MSSSNCILSMVSWSNHQLNKRQVKTTLKKIAFLPCFFTQTLTHSYFSNKSFNKPVKNSMNENVWSSWSSRLVDFRWAMQLRVLCIRNWAICQKRCKISNTDNFDLSLTLNIYVVTGMFFKIIQRSWIAYTQIELAFSILCISAGY